MDVSIVVISTEALQSFTQPGLDLQTGQLIELAPPEPEPEQLALDLQDAP